MFLGRLVAAVAASSLVLTGCSAISKSEAWQQGFSDQNSISATKIYNYMEAYAYCQTILETLYPTANSQQATDYTLGCMSYVYTGENNPGSTSGDSSGDLGGDTSAVDTSSGVLDRLNSAGYSEWDYDPVNNTSGIPAIEVILGEDGEDGSSCAVWVFQDEATATQEAKNGDFDWVSGNFWYGSDDYGYGAILIADYSDDNCALDAADALNWNLD